MLNINPEIVCAIIAKSREFFAKEEIIMPEEPKEITDDWYYDVLLDYSDDLTFCEIKTAINDLEPDQQATLVALCWVGRGDFEADEWDSAFQEARRNWNKRTAEYLLTKPHLPNYLEEALSLYGYSCNGI